MSGERKLDQTCLDFDYIIVGAGSAGCVIAGRLLEQTDATILLLEAGGPAEDCPSITNPTRWVENIGTAHDWTYAYAPSPHTNNRTISLSQGKGIGGSGSINALVWARGNKADYDGWAAAGNRGWDYDSVLPLFKKSEDWEGGHSATRGTGGPLRIERAKDLHPVATALVEAGLSCGMPYLDDINVPEPEGVGPINMNVAGGRRWSTARAFLEPIAASARLTVSVHSRATRLRCAGAKCIGVDFIKDGVVQSARASAEVVLCLGAIETPRLLLLSGIGPKEDLHSLDIPIIADSPNVGKNLQDHPLIAGLCFASSQQLPTPNNNLEGSVLFAKSRSGLEAADLMFVSIQVPYVSPEIAEQRQIPPHSFCIAPGLVRVESRGYLRMLSSRFDGPLDIQPNLMAEPADIEALLTGMELGFELASQSAFKNLIDRWVTPSRPLSRGESLAFLRQACCSYFHPVGTCAMGSGSNAVVDGELRVRGVTGLRIADASIMPRITSANTQAPTVMIAEFASRLITCATGYARSTPRQSTALLHSSLD